MYKLSANVEIFQNEAENKVIITNKVQNRMFVIGLKEAETLSLMDGVRSAAEISEIVGYYDEKQVDALAEQFLGLGILDDGTRKDKRKINPLKIKIHILNPNEIVKGNLCTILYYLIWFGSLAAITAGIINGVFHYVNGTEEVRKNLILSVDITKLKLWDLVPIYLIQFLCFALHEMGHMVTARHYGVNVFDMGIMLYWFIPCAYTNLTHMTFNKSKREKLQILFAGIIVDLGTIGLFSCLFGLLPVGRISLYLLICTLINMISFVGNLMVFIKFDGYYILQVIMEEENLRMRSFAMLKAVQNSLAVKIKNRDKNIKVLPTNDDGEREDLAFYIVYAAVSMMYIPVILLGVIFSFV